MLISLLLTSLIAYSQETKTVPDGFESGGLVDVSVISQDQAKKLFRDFQSSKNIPFGYPMDGCYARATEMALLAEEKKIQMAKIYNKGILRVKTKSPLYPKIEWGYHVAPVAYVKNKNNKAELMVFDPSLFSEPVPVESWNKIMLAEGNPPAQINETYYGARYQLGPKQYVYEGGQKKYSWHKEDLDMTNSALSRFSGVIRNAVKWVGYEPVFFHTVPPPPVNWGTPPGSPSPAPQLPSSSPQKGSQ